MTSPVLTLVAVGGGALIAHAARGALVGATVALRTRYGFAALMFAGLVTTSGFALYATYPDWSLMYLANPTDLPVALVWVGLAVVYLGGAPAGFLLAHRVLQRDSLWAFRAGLLGLAFAVLTILLLGADRFGSVTYYHAYHHRLPSLALAESGLLPIVIVHALILVFALVFTLRVTARHSAHFWGQQARPSALEAEAGKDRSDARTLRL